MGQGGPVSQPSGVAGRGRRAPAASSRVCLKGNTNVHHRSGCKWIQVALRYLTLLAVDALDGHTGDALAGCNLRRWMQHSTRSLLGLGLCLSSSCPAVDDLCPWAGG